MTEKTQIVITAKDETRAAIASAQRGLHGLSSSAAGLRNSFAFLGSVGGLAGLLGGATLASTVKTAVDSLDKLNDAAERVGVSVEDLSALDFAGKLNGLEFEDLTTALTKLSVKMQDAAGGSKEAAAYFEALGIKVTDSSGRLKTADAVFAEVAEAFAGMEDGAGKTALAVEGFGRSGAKLVPLLNQGADGLKKMREEGEALGGVIDGKLAKQAGEFNDNLDRLSVVSAAAGRAIAAEFLPMLTRLSEEFLIGIKNSDSFLGALNAFGTINPFKNTAENLASVRGELAKMEADLKNYGYIDDVKEKRLKTQLAYLKEIQVKESLVGSEGNYGNEGRGLTASTAKKAAPIINTGASSAGRAAKTRAEADEAARLLQNLREQIALKDFDLQSTDKLTGAEKERAKTLYQLDAGTLKATASQREAILASYENLVALEKLLTEQEDYRKAVEGAEQANAKQRSAMLDQIVAAENAVEIMGLTADQISVVEQARLADAIAIARENGASDDQIAFLEEELALRSRLSDALIEGRGKELEKKDAEELIKSVEGLDEFTKQAARNMQDAMADFFIDPTKDGIESLATSFAQTVQKMIVQAGSAQLMNLLFGDMGKDGKVGGLAGSILGAAGGFDWASLFSFSNGGIMTSAGAVPLRKYASGGIANSAQLAMFGEGSTPEAYVPLPDGRRIPVAMSGGQNMNLVQNFYGPTEPAQVKRAAASAMRQVAGAVGSSRRYA